MPRFSLFSRAVPDAVEAAAAACGSDEQIDPYKGVTEEIIKLTYAKKLRRLRLAALLQTAVEQDKLERARRLELVRSCATERARIYHLARELLSRHHQNHSSHDENDDEDGIACEAPGSRGWCANLQISMDPADALAEQAFDIEEHHTLFARARAAVEEAKGWVASLVGALQATSFRTLAKARTLAAHASVFPDAVAAAMPGSDAMDAAHVLDDPNLAARALAAAHEHAAELCRPGNSSDAHDEATLLPPSEGLTRWMALALERLRFAAEVADLVAASGPPHPPLLGPQPAPPPLTASLAVAGSSDARLRDPILLCTSVGGRASLATGLPPRYAHRPLEPPCSALPLPPLALCGPSSLAADEALRLVGSLSFEGSGNGASGQDEAAAIPSAAEEPHACHGDHGGEGDRREGGEETDCQRCDVLAAAVDEEDASEEEAAAAADCRGSSAIGQACDVISRGEKRPATRGGPYKGEQRKSARLASDRGGDRSSGSGGAGQGGRRGARRGRGGGGGSSSSSRQGHPAGSGGGGGGGGDDGNRGKRGGRGGAIAEEVEEEEDEEEEDDDEGEEIAVEEPEAEADDDEDVEAAAEAKAHRDAKIRSWIHAYLARQSGSCEPAPASLAAGAAVASTSATADAPRARPTTDLNAPACPTPAVPPVDADAFHALCKASAQLRTALRAAGTPSVPAPTAAAGARAKGKGRGKARAEPLDLFGDETGGRDGQAAGWPAKLATLRDAARVTLAAAREALRPTDHESWAPLADVARFACLQCVQGGDAPDWRGYARTMKTLLPQDGSVRAEAAIKARIDLQDFLYVASHVDEDADEGGSGSGGPPIRPPIPAFASDRKSQQRLSVSSLCAAMTAAEGRWARKAALAANGEDVGQGDDEEEDGVAATAAHPPARRAASKPSARPAAGPAAQGGSVPGTPPPKPSPWDAALEQRGGGNGNKRTRATSAAAASRMEDEDEEDTPGARGPLLRLIGGVWRQVSRSAARDSSALWLPTDDLREEQEPGRRARNARSGKKAATQE